MSLSSQLKTDPNKEVNGVPVEFEPNNDGSVPTFHIGRMVSTNQAYQAALTSATAPFKRAIQLGTFSEKKSTEINRTVFVNTLLKGWENVLLSDVTGDPAAEGFAEFSKANAFALFKNIPDIYNELFMFSNSINGYLVDRLEVEAKN